MNLIRNIEIKKKGFVVEREDKSKSYYLFNKIASFRLIIESGEYIPKNCNPLPVYRCCRIHKLDISFGNSEFSTFTGCKYTNSTVYLVNTFEEATHINSQIDNLFNTLKSLLN